MLVSIFDILEKELYGNGKPHTRPPFTKVLIECTTDLNIAGVNELLTLITRAKFNTE